VCHEALLTICRAACSFSFQFLEAIKSPVQVVSHTAAQVLAAYGAVDVPRNAWPDLLAALFHNISDAAIGDVTKVASLEVPTLLPLFFSIFFL